MHEEVVYNLGNIQGSAHRTEVLSYIPLEKICSRCGIENFQYSEGGIEILYIDTCSYSYCFLICAILPRLCYEGEN